MEGEMIKESSGSNCCNNTLPAGNLPRNGNIAPSGRFKGVVSQQNGHWGAQIYAKHQRIWLGTFKSETEAAMAYDSAAIKIRSGDSYRNIPWSDITVREPDFQAQYSWEVVLNMIKDGSYQSRFGDYLRDHSQIPKEEEGENAGDGRLCCKQLFEKELTPSDVGKLNRLVIPKKYAVKYLPPISNEDGGSDDMELVFLDRLMRLWKFRYCYWSSSQSYVFTRGWNRFVKENDLKAKETIKFFLCERGGAEQKHKFCMIDVQINAEGTSHNVGKLVKQKPASGDGVNMEVDVVDLQLALRPTLAIKEKEMEAMNLELHLALRPSGDDEAQAQAEGFTLFGVHMNTS